MNRRKFIKNGTIASTGFGLVNVIPAVRLSVNPPSDNLNVALIGCRNMGFGILEHHLSNNGINCVALCDVNDNILIEKASDIKMRFNQSP